MEQKFTFLTATHIERNGKNHDNEILTKVVPLTFTLQKYCTGYSSAGQARPYTTFLSWKLGQHVIAASRKITKPKDV